jgi:hypothetical protein
MTRTIGVDIETPGVGPRIINGPSPRRRPWAGHPGLFIMEPDYSGIELYVMEIIRREQERATARRRPLQVFRPVLPPFWPSRPARDSKRPGALPASPSR